MPQFRFLHASDFHLERPPGGLAELPDHLRELLIEAPYRAANKVFDAAIANEVDFVLLAGDLVAPERSGPRGILFLREQFERLAAQNIDVYWVGGVVDAVHTWPHQITWPANVHLFSVDQPARYAVVRDGRQSCEIVGQSSPPDGSINVAGLTASGAGPFTIGLIHGDVDDEVVRRDGFDYWALGGQHEPTLPQDGRPLVHHPGSPQGRSSGELGPHGCTLVDVSETGAIETEPVVTDVVRYFDERMTLPADCAPVEAERLLRERMQSLVDTNPHVTLLVSITLEGLESATHAKRSQFPLPAITGMLRGEFGYGSPPAWVAQVRLTPPSALGESLYGQETLLGDFLQAARGYDPLAAKIDVARFVPTHDSGASMLGLLRLDDRAVVQASLEEAANLGAGLLLAEEAHG